MTAPPATRVHPPSARWPLLFALLSVALVLAVAGVPGVEREAGDGSERLQRGWAEQRAREAGWTQDAQGRFVPPAADAAPAAPR